MKISDLIHRSKFVEQVLTLLLGTGISQIIQVATMPAVSRIYSPADIGIYALFMSTTALLTIPSSGRYDRAILIPKEESDAVILTMITVMVSFCYCFLLFLLISVFGGMVADMAGRQEVKIWLTLIPLTVFAMSIYQIFYTYLNRLAEYRILSTNRIIRVVVMVAVTIVMGLMSVKPMGLIWGFIAGTVAATSLLSLAIARIYLPNRVQFSLARGRELLKRYKDFPKYSIASALANGASGEMPIFLLTAFFSAPVVGYYSLASKALGVPSSLIANSFGDVFQEWASKEIHANANCSVAWKKTAKSLLYVSTPLYLVLFFAAPVVVPIVFGSEWAVSGLYMQILIPFVYLSFTASPLSRTLYLMERQDVELMWQLALVVLTVVSITVGAKLGSAVTCIGLYSATYAAMYLVYLRLSHRVSQVRRVAVP